ncbi:nucleoside triphosphate pyrophosphohydrolase [Rossellomorea aquimaris]|uniref:nucleoside triphosphate pyrophosphohydrolase n=1 Tax=Rossellomorea aquimaris TaxID=189382 RepID=UPI0007D0680F|nr:nucleoside triphosphate pyrophosphohydrolase [Rossellomorea aquimaris]
MTAYNKLVRDNIPSIIDKTGMRFTTRILSEKEYIQFLKEKGFEELKEYCKAGKKQDAIEELADLLEVMNALAATHGSSIEEVERVRKKKAENRGGFQKKIFLIEVED